MFFGLLRRDVYRLTAATGGTRAGVSRPHLTALFTWSMPSTAPGAILATSITSALATAALPSARH